MADVTSNTDALVLFAYLVSIRRWNMSSWNLRPQFFPNWKRISLLVTFSCGVLLGVLGCGGAAGGGSVTPPPPSVIPTPTLVWPGDAQATTNVGDNAMDALPRPPGTNIIPDGSGGALITFEDDWNGVIYAQRLDSRGNRMWSEVGIPVAPDSPFQTGLATVADGSGGMIVAFVDGRAGSCGFYFRASCQIYAQRFDSFGNILWQANGIPIDTAPGNQGSSGISIASDGTGGAFLAWQDARACCAIYAQHITASGQLLWSTDGVAVSPPPTLAAGDIGLPPIVMSDGTGGALVAWWNLQVPYDQNPFLSMQRLDSQGQLLWPAGGSPVSLHLVNRGDSGVATFFNMASDGAGGAIIAAVDNEISSQTPPPTPRRVMVQRMNSNGENLWATNGVSVTSTTIPQTYPTLIADGAGGAIVSWRNCDPLGFQDCDIFAQRLDSSGNLLWGNKGVSICSAPGVQAGQQIVSDGNGGAFITWNDCRRFAYPSEIYTGCFPQLDIYGQQVNSQGTVLWQVDGFPISTAPGSQGPPITEEFVVPSYSLSADGQGGAFLAWPDGRDGPCGMNSAGPGPGNSMCELRAQHVRP